MRALLLIAVSCILQDVISQGNVEEYCDLHTQHIVCTNPGFSNRCGTDYIEAIPTDDDIATILKWHNDIRRLVANGQETKAKESLPQAANMRELIWDEELAFIAQANANDCLFKHDSDEYRHVLDGTSYNQNIAMIISFGSLVTNVDYPRLLRDLYTNEVIHFSLKYAASFQSSPEGDIGHYTQIIWADTYKVGCGAIIFKEQGLTKRYGVCNFAPHGNVDKQPVYQFGSPCSQCPVGTTCSDSLCEKMRTLLPIAIFFILQDKSSQVDREEYCKLHRQHIVCKNSGFGPACGTEYIEAQPTDADITDILNWHNDIRTQVVNGTETKAMDPLPPASNMRKLTWDDELAFIAQANANECLYKHDCQKCRLVLDAEWFTSYGQNIAILTTSEKNVTSVNFTETFKNWYTTEVIYFSSEYASSFQQSPDDDITHYTQIIWANTTKVGCGGIIFKEEQHTKVYIVCNYGPAGNIPKAPVYKFGEPCSDCPVGTTCSDLLCVMPSIEKDEENLSVSDGCWSVHASIWLLSAIFATIMTHAIHGYFFPSQSFPAL